MGGTVGGAACSTTPGSSRPTVVYNPKAFLPHAASLHQGCPHCARFPTAASRRSLGRVSVPVWLIILSDQLRIVTLVSRYLTNKLIRRIPIFRHHKAFIQSPCGVWTSCGISHGFPRLSRA